jgi:SAM-dependent methyltransferase
METTWVSDGPEARPLLELATSFWGAKTLLTAVELGVFTALGDGPAKEVDLRARLGLHPRSSRDFLDALVALRVLDRAGEHYSNTPIAAHYLDETRPDYLGGWMNMTNRRLYEAWRSLAEGLRSGGPQLAGPMTDNFFADFYQDPVALRRFIAGMDSLSNRIGDDLAQSFDWSGYDTFCDVGGARGNVSCILANANPHLRGICFDLPHLKPLFEEHVGELGLEKRIEFQSGDFFAEPLPEADVMVMGHILHDWNVEQRHLLLKKAFDAIRPGGALLVYDRMIDDGRRDRALSLLGSLNLLLVTPGGSEYTAAECRGWLTEVGFSRMSALPVLDRTETVVIARKGR